MIPIIQVLFSGGLEHSASEIADYVLASVSMVSPPLVGVLHKVFPYAALTNLDFLEEPGYVAGVTNPMFSQRQSWYDLCCQVDAGNLKFHQKEGFLHPEKEKHYTMDVDFIRKITAKIKAN